MILTFSAVTEHLFSICILNKLYECIANTKIQCYIDQTLITVNSSKFDNDRIISNIVFWDSKANVLLDEKYTVGDKHQGHCFESE